ncbi:MAG TPA: hypothetical protein VGO62_19740, partial [Myxococcota bacterium]
MNVRAFFSFALATIVGAALPSCFVDTSIGDDLQLSCSGGSACPSGRSCVDGRCLTPAQLAVAEVAFVDGPTVAAGEEVRSAKDGKDTFHVDATLNDEATVTASSDLGDVVCSQSAGAQYTCVGTVHADAAEGAHAVAVVATDSIGRSVHKSVDVAVDRTGPTATLVSVAIASADQSEVSAAGAGAAVVMTIALSEPASTVTVVGAPPSTWSATVAAAGNLVTATLVVDAASVPEGAVAIVVDAIDAVDNEQATNLSAVFTSDFTAPAAPDVDTPLAVVYARAPWGDAAGAAPRFSLTGAAGSAEPSATVIVSGDAAGALVLAQLPVLSDGSFAGALAIGDIPQLFVRAVDEAGNASAVVRVRDGSWTATPASPAGSPPNPATLEATPHLERALVDDAMVAIDASGLGVAAVSASAVGDWRERVPSANPPPRKRAGIAYDAGHDVVVLFGGADQDGTARSDTFIFDGERFSEKQPAHRPPARSDCAMAYDAASDRTVLFGGTTTDGSPGTLLGDTWLWDGNDWTPLAGSAPAPRAGARMAAVDDDVTAHETLLLFGGDDGGSRSDVLDESWQFDGAARTWAEIGAGDAAPPPRVHGALTSSSAGPVLFGGEDASGPLGDTWLFHGGAWVEHVAAGAESPPVPQAGGGLARIAA